MNDEQDELSRLRDRIDSIDRQILKNISERAQCAQQLAAVKLKNRANSDVTFYRPEREAQVLREIMDVNPGPLRDEEVARLFRELMSACLALENPMKIAFLGPAGTFTHAATLKHFGGSVNTLPHQTIEEVFREVEAGAAHYGVVPVETSSEGIISHTLDVFVNSPLTICGEVQVRSHYYLLAPPAVRSEDIQTIYSKDSGFSNCRHWLDNNWSAVERISLASYEQAAKTALEQEHSAVVAGEVCASLFGLTELAGNIENHPNQIARYLVLGRDLVAPSGNDRTSVIVTIKDEPVALYRMLVPFYQHGLSLTRLDSRPALSGERRYHFFIDFSGHWDSPAVQEAIKQLSTEVLDVRHLGSYPLGVL